MGTLTLTTVAASVAYYFVTRPLPEKPLVPLENQSPLLEVRAWRIPYIHICTCICMYICIYEYTHTYYVIFSLSQCGQLHHQFVDLCFFLFKSEVKQIHWAAFDVHMSRAVFCMPHQFRFCCRHMILLISIWSRDFTRFCLLFSP